jgi:glycosyltransferase 2 family protein
MASDHLSPSQSKSSGFHLFSKKTWGILRVVGAIVIFIGLIALIDVREMYSIWQKSPWWLLVGVVVLAVFRLWLYSIKWMLVTPPERRYLSQGEYFRYTILSNTFGIFMVSGFGSDIVRSIMVISDDHEGKTRTFLAILLDRYLSLVALGGIAIALFVFMSGIPFDWQTALVLTVFISVLVGIAFSYPAFLRLGEYLSKKYLLRIPILKNNVRHFRTLHASLYELKEEPLRYSRVLFLSGFLHFVWFTIVYLLAWGMQIPIGFLQLAFATALVIPMTILPISLSGLGVREFSYIYILNFYGISAEAATALSLAQFFLLILTAFMGVPLMVGARVSRE